MHKVALIGAGVISESHVLAWRHIQDAELSVVVDIDKEVAARRAKAWGIKTWLTHYPEILSDPEITICDICLPHFLHARVTQDCLRARKHVLCEKPIALTLKDGRDVMTEHKESGKTLMIGENWYYLPVVVKALELYQNGEFGEIYSIRANLDFPGLRSTLKDEASVRARGWRGTLEQSGGGILMDAGIHSLSVARLFLGEVKMVWALEGKSSGTETGSLEDTINVMCRFEGGSTGLFHFAEASGWQDCHFDFTLLGTDGVLEIDILPETVRLHKGGQVRTFNEKAAGGMIEEIEHFVACISNGSEPLSGPVDQIRSLAAILAAYDSMREGGQPRRPENVV